MQGYPSILQYWKKSQKDFENNLTILQQQINTDAVHDIRVAIKKLRAFLNLYMIVKNEPDFEILLSKTNDLFDVLGRYRDIEICLAQTIAFEKDTGRSCKEFKSCLQSLLKITRAWANQEIHRFHKKELAKIALLLKQDSSLADNIMFSKALAAVIINQLAETKKHFRQPHLVRRNLKEIYYWVPLFDNESTQDTWYQKELHSILDDLGNWQDQEILDVRIRHFRKDYLPKSFEEYERLKDFQNKIKDSKKVLLKAANSKARRWIKKVTDKEKSEV